MKWADATRHSYNFQKEGAYLPEGYSIAGSNKDLGNYFGVIDYYVIQINCED